MNYKYNEIMKLINKGQKPLLVYQISKEEVLTGDMKGLKDFFDVITRVGVDARQSVTLLCSGYDDVSEELFEIPEVRRFVRKLFAKFPYVLYYISVAMESDQWLLSSVADNVVNFNSGERLTATELVAKYGANPPLFMAKLTFEEGRLADILSGIMIHGKQLSDSKDADKIAVEYAMRFDNSEETLKEMRIRSWKR